MLLPVELERHRAQGALLHNAVMSHYIIGLTGGIASGKSAIEKAFLARGVFVADADLIAREIVEPEQPPLAEIVARFGPEVLGADGRLDRAALRVRIFHDDDARRALEAILHPRIRAATEAAGQAATGAYVIYVVPLLIESGSWRERVTRVLAIDCSEDTQVARVMQRSHLSADEVRAIMATQVTRARRLAEADDVVDNDAGLEALRAQVQALHERYLALSL